MFKLLALLPLLLVLVAPSAFALTVPTVTFIPDKISTNAAFIMIADPHASQSDSVNVRWSINGPTPNEINWQGSFPKISGRYVCYFSNTDNQSTCGPAPLRTSSYPNPQPRSFSVVAVNQYNTTGITVANISVGDIPMNPSVYTENGFNISVTWSTTFQKNLYYKVYYASNFTDAGYSGSVQHSGDGYAINIPTGPGDYIISFRIDEVTVVSGQQDTPTGRFGGTAVHFSMPRGGSYVGSASLYVDPVSFDVILNRNQNFQKTGYIITNLGNNQISNLSVDIPQGYASLFSITPSNDSIAPNGTIYYTVTIGGAQHVMEINTNVNITSNDVTIGSIPVAINVSIATDCSGAAPLCPVIATSGGGITVTPDSWLGDYLVGSPPMLNFTITNIGNATISNLSGASDLGSSLELSLPTSILPRGYAPATATFNPGYSGVKSGTITISSETGTAKIIVLANFHDDITESISSFQSDYASFQSNLTAAQRTALASTFSGIDSEISNAQSAQENGDYASAADYYARASAKLEALQGAFSSNTPINPTPVPVDITTILIIVVIVAAAAFAFFFIRKRRAGAGSDETEEQLAEDFGPLPEQ